MRAEQRALLHGSRRGSLEETIPGGAVSIQQLDAQEDVEGLQQGDAHSRRLQEAVSLVTERLDREREEAVEGVICAASEALAAARRELEYFDTEVTLLRRRADRAEADLAAARHELTAVRQELQNAREAVAGSAEVSTVHSQSGAVAKAQPVSSDGITDCALKETRNGIAIGRRLSLPGNRITLGAEEAKAVEAFKRRRGSVVGVAASPGAGDTDATAPIGSPADSAVDEAGGALATHSSLAAKGRRLSLPGNRITLGAEEAKAVEAFKRRRGSALFVRASFVGDGFRFVSFASLAWQLDCEMRTTRADLDGDEKELFLANHGFYVSPKGTERNAQVNRSARR